MGESNSVRVALVQRTSFDTAAALNLLVLPVTGQSMRNRVGYQQSAIIRTDPNVQDLVRLSADVSGGLPVEFSFPVASEAAWFLYRAALRATETAERSESSCTTTAGAKTITKAAIDFTTGNTIEVGDIVRVSDDSADPSDSGFYPVTAVTATTVTVQRSSNFTGSIGDVTLRRGARMKNGTQKYYFDVEVGRTDVSLFELFRKVVVDGFDLSISDGGIITANFSLLGATSVRNTSTYALSTANPTVTAIMDALGVPDIRFAGTQSTSKSLGVGVGNGIVSNTQVGSLGPQSFSWGPCTVRTRWQGYLATWAEMANYTANTTSDIWFVMQDSSNRAVSFSMPEHKWSDLTTDTRGLGQTDYIDGSGQAFYDSTQACSIRMQRWV